MVILAVSFGELDISPTTVAILVGLSLFTFAAVAISSLNLVKSLFDDDSDN